MIPLPEVQHRMVHTFVITRTPLYDGPTARRGL